MRIHFDTAQVPRETLGPEAKTHKTQLIDRLKLIHDQAAQNTKGALAIRRIFSLVDMITKPIFSNCHNVFKFSLFR